MRARLDIYREGTSIEQDRSQERLSRAWGRSEVGRGVNGWGGGAVVSQKGQDTQNN